MKCDGFLHCVDGSDEFDCCNEDEFECECVKKGNCNCNCRQCVNCGCINKTVAEKIGLIECPNERRKTFGSNGAIRIYKLTNISECDKIGFLKCDNSTCYSFHSSTKNANDIFSYVLCTSVCSDKPYCHKKSAFQCSHGSYIFLDHFCDGVVDCIDGSDEIVSQPGFKCNQCVLPQNNLYDDLAQCEDKSDLCLFANSYSCFECLDKRLLISSKQVCDGINDCYDLSDECLCDINVNAKQCVSLFETKRSSCFEKSKDNFLNTFIKIDVFNRFSRMSNYQYISCPTKNGSVIAIRCDGRPECKDYRDECECYNPPAFCNDSCYSFFPMGDRYCDGVEDPAWIYLNNSVCSKGFDELECPKRFKCNATGNVSIDVQQICDGKPDCDDGSDENNCTMERNEPKFSSDTEMIANPVIKAAFWIMGFIVLFSNAYVVANTTQFLKSHKDFNFNWFIILNISVADFIMGVYLMTIAVFSEIFSGNMVS